MDAKHAAKAQEAGISPPVSPPDSVIVEDEPKPAVSKKCFCMIVFLVLVGGVVGILTILKREKMEKELALATSTTVAPTTIAISKLEDDDEVLKRCQKKYTAKLGKDSIGLIKTGVNDDSGKELKKGAFWLRGDPVQDQQATFKDIKVMACRGQIPTVIISMRPAGYKLILNQDDLNFYDGEPIHEDWESYDERLNVYKKQLLDIPSLVILEPKLLQLTFDEINQQYNYENGIYLDEFLRRAQMMTNALKKSWVYLDAGDPAWLSVDAHLEFASMTLVRLQGLRGFAINTAFYSNSTTVELFARQLSCATNLHYIMDTGRNGGAFSQKSTLEEAAECRFDPPNIKKSNNPGWGFASKKPVDARGRRRRSAISRGRRGLYSTDFGVQQQVSRGWSSQGPFLNANVRNTLANAPMDGMPQLKMANGFGAGGNGGLPSRTSSGKIRAIHKAPRGNPGLAGPGPKAPGPKSKAGNGLLDRETAEGIMKSISMKNNRMRCKSKSSKMNYHDAYFWARAPGESDGRLFPAGSVHKCLLNHKLTCDGSCPLITSVPCTCSGAPPMQQHQSWGHQQNWGYQPNYIPQPQPQLNPWNPRTWG